MPGAGGQHPEEAERAREHHPALRGDRDLLNCGPRYYLLYTII